MILLLSSTKARGILRILFLVILIGCVLVTRPIATTFASSKADPVGSLFGVGLLGSETRLGCADADLGGVLLVHVFLMLALLLVEGLPFVLAAPHGLLVLNLLIWSFTDQVLGKIKILLFGLKFDRFLLIGCRVVFETAIIQINILLRLNSTFDKN